MTTIIIEESNPQAKKFIEFARTLPFATIVEEKRKKKSFRQVCDECRSVTADTFFDELNARIEQWPDHA